jgi:hypothetical protein
MLSADDRVFRAMATTVVPEASELGDSEWDELFGIIDRALQQRPRALRRQLAALMSVLNYLPVPRYGRRFTGLDADTRYRFLHSLESSPVPLLRKGLWGLRTLILMGYYTRPAVAEMLGYRASAGGWAQPRATA